MALHRTVCPLCEAGCGLLVQAEGSRVVSLRGDEEDPQSRGYLCPKASALADLQHDPDRLRRPLVRDGGTLREASWEEALERAGEGLAAARERYGRDALAVYYGNPTGHNLGLLTHGLPLSRALRTRNVYSASSADQLPQMLASEQLYGHFAMLPVPDVDRTDYLLVLGANPVVSNGSVLTAPDMKRRLRELRARGGTLVVLDPRRTETAELATEHHFLRPGTDVFLLAAMLRVLFEEGLARLGRLGAHCEGLQALRSLVAPFTPERAAPLTGIDAATLARLARDFAGARTAAAYGRLGMCTQEHGTSAAWLLQCLNILAGRLDAEGGMLFTRPAVDLLAIVEALGMARGRDRWRSRVRGLSEVAGELPVAALAEELEHRGEGQIRALLTFAGNPALSAPNGPRLERALGGLDFMVSVDGYLNETTRHAHVVLPPVAPLSRSHYDLALNAFAVRNVARYTEPVFQRGPEERYDWELLSHLAARLLAPKPLRKAFLAAALRGPEPLLALGLLLGPYGLRRGAKALTLGALRAMPHGADFGPLEPRLPGILRTPGRKIRLVTPLLGDELARLAGTLDAPREAGLVLIGRRSQRSNNSWMHNAQRLVKGPDRCTLKMHPQDALARGVAQGARVRVRSRVGSAEVTVELTDELMPGVVSLPHGWGHSRPGTRLRVAEAHAGVSANDLTDEAHLDHLSGTAGFNGVPVTLEPLGEQALAHKEGSV